jgi:hypothetical protein
VRRRRESRREEQDEHIKLAGLLARYLDPACTFSTSLENKPISAVSGMYQKAARRAERASRCAGPVSSQPFPLLPATRGLRRAEEQARHRQIRLEMLPSCGRSKRVALPRIRS